VQVLERREVDERHADRTGRDAGRRVQIREVRQCLQAELARIAKHTGLTPADL
jgi:hypothetical protein